MTPNADRRIRSFLLRVEREELEARARIFGYLNQRFQSDCRFIVPWQKHDEAQETEDVDDYKVASFNNPDLSPFF